MKLRIQGVTGIRSRQIANSSEVILECDMTERQMHDALLGFLETISGETWQRWVNEIDRDFGEGAPHLFTAGWEAGFQEALTPDSKPDQDRCTAAYLQMVGSGMIQP